MDGRTEIAPQKMQSSALGSKFVQEDTPSACLLIMFLQYQLEERKH